MAGLLDPQKSVRPAHLAECCRIPGLLEMLQITSDQNKQVSFVWQKWFFPLDHFFVRWLFYHPQASKTNQSAC